MEADTQARQHEALAPFVAEADIIVTTAQIPGRPAPLLITDEMVASMRPGAVIVDMAAATGGNVAPSKPDEIVTVGGVRIHGPTNLAAQMPGDASRMYSRNLVTLLKRLHAEGKENEVCIGPDPVFGFEIISKVPPTLHTPLMSGANAISGITIVGALAAASFLGEGIAARVLVFLAVMTATINVVGGFLVTDRMLEMFKKKN